MKCWKSAFNAQGWKLIYSSFKSRSSNGGAKENERQGETQFTTQNWGSPTLEY
jgi:hypothetical protein